MRTLRPGLIGLLALLLIATCVHPATAADSAGQLTCHFFVIPAAADIQGGESTLIAFKTELAKLAGGFTALGQASGGMIAANGTLETDNHLAFVVSSPKDLSKDIRHLVKTVLKRDNLYLVSWPVSGGYLPNP